MADLSRLRFAGVSRQVALSAFVGLTLCGCSSTKMAEIPKSKFPARETVSVPGTSDVSSGNELRHPETLHLAYGRWQEQQKQLPQARESYTLALRHDPKSVEALLGLSRLDRLAGRNAEAEQHLKKAEHLRPSDPLVAAGWAEYYSAQGRWPEAVAKYRQAIAGAPTETLYRHQLAVTLAKSGDLPQSLAEFTAIVGEAEAHYNVGFLLQQQGKLVEAEEQFQRALALKPDLIPAATMLAKARRDRGLPVPEQFAGLAPKAPKAPTVTSTLTTTSEPPYPQGTPEPVGAVIPASAVDSPVQPATWRSDAGSTHGGMTPPPGLSPAQLEQWQNQQVPGR